MCCCPYGALLAGWRAGWVLLVPAVAVCMLGSCLPRQHLGPMGAVQHNAALEMESAMKSRYSCIAINDNLEKEVLYLESLWVSELTSH